MLNQKNSHKLECHTSKYKLKEAKFFLEQLKLEENWNDDEKFSFYLNAFVLSATSIIEYVHSDFLYNTIADPRIKWRDWENHDKRKQIISSHPQSKAIEKFLGYFSNERKKILDDTLVNYFLYKRNTITHIRWDGSKASSFTEFPDGTKTTNSRNLEAAYKIDLMIKKSEYDPDLFYDQITRENQLAMLKRLCSENLVDICEEYLSKLEKFIERFEGKNFF